MKAANASVAGVVVAALVFVAYGTLVFEGIVGTVVIAIAIAAVVAAFALSRRQST